MRGLKTIRGQLTASLVLFELLALLFFAAVLFKERDEETRLRMMRRLEYQSSELEVVTRLALRDNNMEMLHTVVVSMLQFPTISSVVVTNPSGIAIAASDAKLIGTGVLSQPERALLPRIHALTLSVGADGRQEAMMPVMVGGQPAAYIRVYPTEGAARADFKEALRVSVLGAAIVILACTLLATLIARSLTQPLQRLLRATRSIIQNPGDTSAFPLGVTSRNEAADLTIAFNLMVASFEEQRSGLGDTLALLDSMLANAPIGLAFFDRQSRFVRVNDFLTQSHAPGMSQYLGRRVDEVFTPEAASTLVSAIEEVFERGASVQGLEVSRLEVLSAEGAHDGGRKLRTWFVNVYAVRTAGQVTRWAGMVLIDITQRLRTEQALRETEKLAVTGRLSASIAHEINNPLEAVTNLLYLLRQHGSLGQQATEWADAAQHEVARVSDITQQTLRFYRQSSGPRLAKVTELLDSVLALHRGRVATLQVHVERRYRDPGELFCLTGELRQVFANLVGNALDAMQSEGGRLTLSVRASRSWKHPREAGIRVTVADTGCGMSAAVRKRIFEPFYTTKEATGTGLGLWVSSEIMVKHQVDLRLRSRESPVGRENFAGGGRSSGGTVFMLFFPAVASPVAAVAPALEASGVF